MDTLFSSMTLRFFVAFIVVFGLIGLAAWLVRRFSATRLSEGGRGRQPRLAVIEAGAVDARRRLVLIRRDNVEHLLMIGGPSDIVVEQNIVRGQAARELATTRTNSLTEPPLPRAVPLAEPTSWPLQPETAAPRAARPAPLEDPAQWAFEPAPPPMAQPAPAPAVTPRAPRPDRALERGVDALSGLAAELSTRGNGHADLHADPRMMPAFDPASAQLPEPTLAPAAATPAPAAAHGDQNLADMAQRLEAALRRPAAPAETARPAAPAKATNGAARPMEAPAVRPEPRVPAAGPSAEDKKAFGSLEEEMASLLGRKG